MEDVAGVVGDEDVGGDGLVGEISDEEVRLAVLAAQEGVLALQVRVDVHEVVGDAGHGGNGLTVCGGLCGFTVLLFHFLVLLFLFVKYRFQIL